jgi:hypothetical protein
MNSLPDDVMLGIFGFDAVVAHRMRGVCAAFDRLVKEFLGHCVLRCSRTCVTNRDICRVLAITDLLALRLPHIKLAKGDVRIFDVALCYKIMEFGADGRRRPLPPLNFFSDMTLTSEELGGAWQAPRKRASRALSFSLRISNVTSNVRIRLRRALGLVMVRA